MSDSDSEKVIEVSVSSDVDDINIEIPDKKDLTELIEQLTTLDRDNLNKIVRKLGKTGAINPNGNEFHTTSEKTMLKYFLKKKMQELETKDD